MYILIERQCLLLLWTCQELTRYVMVHQGFKCLYQSNNNNKLVECLYINGLHACIYIRIYSY